jgi:hypothetical protein
VLLPVPARIIRDKVDFVIGINLESSGYVYPFIRNAMDVMNMADRIRYKKIIEDSLTGIDFLFSPDLEPFCWGDFSRGAELVKKGENEVLTRSGELFRALRMARIKNFFSLSRFFKKRYCPYVLKA